MQTSIRIKNSIFQQQWKDFLQREYEQFEKAKQKRNQYVISYVKKYLAENPEIIVSSKEIINNYLLYDYNDDLTDGEIENLDKVWQNDFELSKEEFIEMCKNNMHENWRKYSRDSIKYGKFWIKTDLEDIYEPEDLPENINAGELTLNDNIEELWNLPYPKEFIIRIIIIAQNKKYFGVRYINHLCELFKRIIDNKLDCDDNFNSLVKKIIKNIASKYDSKKINIVQVQSNSTYTMAVIALENNNGDMVNAILELTM